MMSQVMLTTAAGWVSAKARVPYAILALFDALRAFPGQVRSDINAVCGQKPERRDYANPHTSVIPAWRA